MNFADRINHKVHLSYKDILLVPYDDSFCKVLSRNDPDISSEICPGQQIDIPIVSSPMDSITGADMAVALSRNGAIGIHTRYIGLNPEADYLCMCEAVQEMVKQRVQYPAIAVGVKHLSLIENLLEYGAKIICIDIANGNHILVKEILEPVATLKNRFNFRIIAGNVASAKSAMRLVNAGADTVKVGIGPGAACTTRRVTGFGVPQFSAILEIASIFRNAGIQDKAKIIADGGVRSSGDVVKALWAGADTVMGGYLFAGCNECPSIEGKKQYRGMASRTVSGRSDVAPEGVCMDVKTRGPVSDVIQQYAASIKAACSMGGALTLEQLRQNVRAIRVSTMSNEESDPVIIS